MSEALERIREEMAAAGADGFFVSDLTNVRYLSGYTSDDAWLFLTPGKGYFITDPRYTELAAAECPDFELVEWRDAYGSLPKAAAAIAEKEGVKKLGFESEVMNVSVYTALKEAWHGEFLPFDHVVEKIRMHKSPEEIQCARNACDITVRAFNRILSDIRPGITEKELAANLSRYMVLEGADTMPYGNILISGARTSLLHGIPSEKSVEYGDLVLMDFGCQYRGYMSDMSRTVVVGKATDMQKEIYSLCLRMTDETEAYMKSGASTRTAYEVSQKAVTGTPWQKYTYSGIGHGVGLFVHEMPFMGPRNEQIIERDTVMTCEPGIYIPGWGGIRIEDTLLVHDDGVENLTPAERKLIEL